MQIELIKKIKETEDTFSFIFMPEKEISWTPGQFALYEIPHKDPDGRGTTRPFSIASAPFEENIMLTTKFDFQKGSTFKKALNNLQIGSIINISGIRGDFVLKKPGGNFIFIAGGIGITPYRSILLDIANHSKNPDITLLYGCKASEMVYKELLEGLADKNEWFKIKYIFEPDLIDMDIISKSINGTHKIIYYISGPPGMVKAIKGNSLLKMNIDEDNITTDYFPGYK